MNNYNNQRHIITVTGEDAKLVRLAEQINIEATRRAQADAGGAITPMIFYETEAERQVMDRLRELEKKYQAAYGLAYPPILVAASAPNPHTVFEVPVKRAREAPTDMELADLCLKRIILKRRGENIYWFNGRFYKLLSPNQFYTLIQDTLREELSISVSSKQLKSVATAILADSRIEVKSEEMNAGGICLRNGVLNLADLKLYEHSPAYFFTWMLDVEYLGEQPCPYCDQFFAYAAGGDPTLIQRLWEALAYALFPDYRAKRFILLMGKGDSGKSVYGSVIESFFDRDFVGSLDIRIALHDSVKLGGKHLFIPDIFMFEALAIALIALEQNVRGNKTLLLFNAVCSHKLLQIRCRICCVFADLMCLSKVIDIIAAEEVVLCHKSSIGSKHLIEDAGLLSSQLLS